MRPPTRGRGWRSGSTTSTRCMSGASPRASTSPIHQPTNHGESANSTSATRTATCCASAKRGDAPQPARSEPTALSPIDRAMARWPTWPVDLALFESVQLARAGTAPGSHGKSRLRPNDRVAVSAGEGSLGWSFARRRPRYGARVLHVSRAPDGGLGLGVGAFGAAVWAQREPSCHRWHVWRTQRPRAPAACGDDWGVGPTGVRELRRPSPRDGSGCIALEKPDRPD